MSIRREHGRLVRSWVSLTVALLVAVQLVWGAAPAARAASITPRDVAITDDEAGRQAARSIDKDGADDQSAWVQLRWERDHEGADLHTGPATIENVVWVAKDLASARAIYQEQSAKNEDFPEAYYSHNGPFPLPISNVGDEVSGMSACVDCNAKEDIFLHHRVTFRRGVVVATVYLYGSDLTAPQSLATWYAVQAVSRVPDSALQAPEGAAMQPGPAPAPSASAAAQPTSGGAQQAAVSAPTGTVGTAIVVAEPKDLAVQIGEAGKNAKVEDEDSGTDDRGSWYEVRFERDGTGGRFYQGPVTVYNRVFVTKDVESAKLTYQEQVALNDEFPEAERRVGQKFELKDASDIGEDAAGISACERSCNARDEIYVHKRLVSRTANVVSVVYIWGLSHEDGTSDWHARYFGGLVIDRARGAVAMPSI